VINDRVHWLLLFDEPILFARMHKDAECYRPSSDNIRASVTNASFLELRSITKIERRENDPFHSLTNSHTSSSSPSLACPSSPHSPPSNPTHISSCSAYSYPYSRRSTCLVRHSQSYQVS